MAAEPPVEVARTAPGPATSLSDPRAVQILATEHWSLLAGRSLVYNEAFTRGGMFLAFLSMSFVGLALLAQAMSFASEFLIITALVLAFDFVIGVLTYVRIAGTGGDDLRHVHGMARLRHAYTEIAPPVVPYLTSATNDDIPSVLTAYGPASTSAFGDIVYGFSTSLGLVGLVTAMVGGVLAAVIGLLIGLSGITVLILGAATALFTIVVMLALTFRGVGRNWAALEVRFPAPAATTDAPVEESAELA